jgi:hypothetical protein
MGTIEVYVASGLRLSLTNVLFVPNSKICLLSVSSLNRSGNYITYFDSMSCWVTNHSGATIIRGALSPNRQLYTVALTSASVSYTPHSPTALYASRMPDVETWHHRLGHCNMWSIVDMAVEGMTIDFHPPPQHAPIAYLGNSRACLYLRRVRAQRRWKGWGEFLWTCVGQCLLFRALDTCTQCT